VQQVVRLLAERSGAHELHLLVGPHALQSSYEVGADVIESFLRQGVQPKFTPSGQPERFLLSLQDTLVALVDRQGPIPIQWYLTDVDTITDTRFHSHRRDGTQAGRNITFIW
jgi:copper oxidase (laccase) domain-containing protein